MNIIEEICEIRSYIESQQMTTKSIQLISILFYKSTSRWTARWSLWHAAALLDNYGQIS